MSGMTVTQYEAPDFREMFMEDDDLPMMANAGRLTPGYHGHRNLNVLYRQKVIMF